MSSVVVSKKFAPFTANGTNLGVITMASTAGTLPGAHVHIISATQPSLACIVVEVLSSTTLAVRATTAVSQWGYSDISAYTVADAASFNQDVQPVQVREIFSAFDKK